MVMDQNFSGYVGPMAGFKFNNPMCLNPNLIHNLGVGDQFINADKTDNRPVSSQFTSSEDDSVEDFDFSDAVLKYINHILMEEDVEDKTCMFQESAALQAAEKSFYEVLGEPKLDQSFESPDEKFGEPKSFCGLGDMETLCPEWRTYPYGHHVIDNVVSPATSHSSCSSSSSNGTKIDGLKDSPVRRFSILDVSSDQGSAMQFKKEVEETRKFLPSHSNLIVETKYDNLFNVEKKFDDEGFLDLSRGKKNPYYESTGPQEERSSKQSAVYSESTVSSDMFDKVLLCSGGNNESALRKELSEVTKSVTKSAPQNSHSRGSSGGKNRGKKQGSKRNVIDLRTLLTLCAQAVASDDRRTANEFLKQVREHSSPTGDGMQRLAHYFANGLEARLAGSGTEIYKSLINKPTSAADVLKAYHIYVATCPFRKISNFFANKTIMNVSQKVTRLHIIDFGILYGFQWPCFLQRLSSRPGGPPKLRVTGIDLPCPGFRPLERVEETGRRLACYAEVFKVPFEFNAIAQKWETIKLEDLKIDKDELLVVNCLYVFRYLLDETVVVNSPRNIVLNLVRKMNPAVFVLGIVNGAYNAPFFITRFREAMFHYSSFFDMLEANIPREIHERMLLEKIVFGQEAMNVIACEAAERIERPEPYKQWQVRNMRAGFEQLPLDKEIMQMAKNRVETSYHKDFVIDADGGWLLQGWKGRIVYALSSWRPAY
ncbi:hypothetical protein CDL12_26158 [Handroanthus impetiginosus]|uniref:Uncharacterized protein n=1 Tax=Handroanthus impetiginosus TaxID=429701 RepID=A0A2G9G822_9LAMI|nr:hypothetical protein CDL12_26158 [Handroanthus impetiginosus]